MRNDGMMPLIVIKRRNWFGWLTVIIALGCPLLLVNVDLFSLGAQTARALLTLFGTLGLEVVLVTTLVISEHRLKKSVAEANLRICPSCGYSLKGLDCSGNCPECGKAFSTGSLLRDWKAFVESAV